MTKQEFEKLVEQGIAEIPVHIQKKMENVDIVIEDLPSPVQLQQAGMPKNALLFGLYQGVPKNRRGGLLC